MHDEVRVVADSPRLSALTAKTVGKALQLMAEKAEYMTFAGMPPSHHSKAHALSTHGNSRLLGMVARVTSIFSACPSAPTFIAAHVVLFVLLLQPENRAAYRTRVMHT